MNDVIVRIVALVDVSDKKPWRMQTISSKGYELGSQIEMKSNGMPEKRNDKKLRIMTSVFRQNFFSISIRKMFRMMNLWHHHGCCCGENNRRLWRSYEKCKFEQQRGTRSSGKVDDDFLFSENASHIAEREEATEAKIFNFPDFPSFISLSCQIKFSRTAFPHWFRSHVSLVE